MPAWCGGHASTTSAAGIWDPLPYRRNGSSAWRLHDRRPPRDPWTPKRLDDLCPGRSRSTCCHPIGRGLEPDKSGLLEWIFAGLDGASPWRYCCWKQEPPLQATVDPSGFHPSDGSPGRPSHPWWGVAGSIHNVFPRIRSMIFAWKRAPPSPRGAQPFG